jgi:hypothetical protein
VTVVAPRSRTRRDESDEPCHLAVQLPGHRRTIASRQVDAGDFCGSITVCRVAERDERY